MSATSQIQKEFEEAEIERLKDRLKAADDVVSYLVIWGVAPTEKLAELITRRMEQRGRDSEMLRVPSAVRETTSPEIARLRDCLETADQVVGYLVLWGAAPTDYLAYLVGRRMEQRVRDKDTLCLPSAVREAIGVKKEGGT